MQSKFRKATGKRPAPFSLRLTFEERAQLEKDAEGTSLSAYIKWRLFDPGRPRPKKRGKDPVKDHKILAALIAKLGKSRLSQNINQLAKAVHTGSLPVTPETEADLQKASKDIADIRLLLIEALGLKE
ncbi:hypothetical protein [Kiloniella sp.]|uniref:hypothetical protein n=1 Tax=Kiloniella sp. TaxID=1938587 RepID=UPI003A9284A4